MYFNDTRFRHRVKYISFYLATTISLFLVKWTALDMFLPFIVNKKSIKNLKCSYSHRKKEPSNALNTIET